MRLEFSVDESQLLGDALSQQDRELSTEIARTDSREFKRMLLHRQHCIHGLQDKIGRNDLQLTSEDLELLREVIEHGYRALLAEIARTDGREFRNALERRADLIGRIREKLDAAWNWQARAATDSAA